MSDIESEIITPDDVADLSDVLGDPTDSEGRTEAELEEGAAISAAKAEEEADANERAALEADALIKAENAALLAGVSDPGDGDAEDEHHPSGPVPQSGQVAYAGPIVQPTRAYLGLSDEAEWDEARFGPEENPPVAEDNEDDE